jgi:hypothetical protein
VGPPFDRRIAAGAFGLAAVVVLATVGLVRASVPAVAARDPNAARDLETLMRAGELDSWSVSYRFVRTLADRAVMRETMQEARDRSVHVLRAGSAMTIDKGDHHYDCNLTGAEFACTGTGAGPVLAPSEVLRVAVSVGAYHVNEAAPATIAGGRARCFRVLATGRGQLPDFGVETDLCLTTAGVPLRQRIVRASGNVDERVAQTFTNRVTAPTIDAIAGAADPNRRTGPQ